MSAKMNEVQSKFMKNALYILQYAKSHLLSWSNIEQWKTKLKALTIVELH